MGGGKKKRSMKQMVKAQRVEKGKGKGKGKKKSSRASGGFSGAETKNLRIVAPNPKDKRVAKELQKMNVLTPYTVASQFNLRLSVAKDLLEDLHRQGAITYVSGGRNIRIYKPSE
ncbi:MAG: hypothetical protein NWF14_06100 [Candidatus Bathyarchaeota archaeon]|nr:hypothetical protein [Candidatus Bathyarchaeota archaeon]